MSNRFYCNLKYQEYKHSKSLNSNEKIITKIVADEQKEELLIQKNKNQSFSSQIKTWLNSLIDH